MQYTGGWEDLAILAIFSTIGIACKHYKFSRPAMLIAFILADKIESFTLQLTTLYTVEDLITRPIFIAIMLFTLGIFAYSFMKKGSIDYA